MTDYEDKNSLIHSFLKTQLSKPTSKDWGQTVLKDIKTLNLNLTINDIEKMPKNTFKALVKNSVTKEALKYLNDEKKQHSKVSHIVHKQIEMEKYLKPGQTTIQESKFLFMIRTRMLEVKGNFRSKWSDLICPCCKQQHLLTCLSLIADGVITGSLPDYNDLFSDNLSRQVELSRIMKQRFKKRTTLTKNYIEET